MKVKRLNRCRISIDIIKVNLKIKLKDCEIRNDLFWVKERIYMLVKEKVYFAIIEHVHGSSLENHAKKEIIYDRVHRYYYWFKMTNIVAQYIKICHACKRNKPYHDFKYKLLKPLSMSKRYFQNISINFIMSFFKCKRNKRIYKNVIIVVNKFSKKRNSYYWTS